MGLPCIVTENVCGRVEVGSGVGEGHGGGRGLGGGGGGGKYTWFTLSACLISVLQNFAICNFHLVLCLSGVNIVSNTWPPFYYSHFAFNMMIPLDCLLNMNTVFRIDTFTFLYYE